MPRQRFYEVIKLPGFPAPVVELAAGPVWLAESVNHFAESWNRKGGRPRKEDARREVAPI